MAGAETRCILGKHYCTCPARVFLPIVCSKAIPSSINDRAFNLAHVCILSLPRFICFMGASVQLVNSDNIGSNGKSFLSAFILKRDVFGRLRYVTWLRLDIGIRCPFTCHYYQRGTWVVWCGMGADGHATSWR